MAGNGRLITSQCLGSQDSRERVDCLDNEIVYISAHTMEPIYVNIHVHV